MFVKLILSGNYRRLNDRFTKINCDCPNFLRLKKTAGSVPFSVHVPVWFSAERELYGFIQILVFVTGSN